MIGLPIGNSLERTARGLSWAMSTTWIRASTEQETALRARRRLETEQPPVAAAVMKFRCLEGSHTCSSSCSAKPTRKWLINKQASFNQGTKKPA